MAVGVRLILNLLGGEVRGRFGCEYCAESRSCLKLGEHGWGWSVGADVCRKNVWGAYSLHSESFD